MKNDFEHFLRSLEIFKFAPLVFLSICHISRVYLRLVANKSFKACA